MVAGHEDTIEDVIDNLLALDPSGPSVSQVVDASGDGQGAALLAPSAVKVVWAGDGRALYFSRSPIPHVRDGEARLEPGLHALVSALTGPLAIQPAGHATSAAA